MFIFILYIYRSPPFYTDDPQSNFERLKMRLKPNFQPQPGVLQEDQSEQLLTWQPQALEAPILAQYDIERKRWICPIKKNMVKMEKSVVQVTGGDVLPLSLIHI